MTRKTNNSFLANKNVVPVASLEKGESNKYDISNFKSAAS